MDTEQDWITRPANWTNKNVTYIRLYWFFLILYQPSVSAIFVALVYVWELILFMDFVRQYRHMIDNTL